MASSSKSKLLLKSSHKLKKQAKKIIKKEVKKAILQQKKNLQHTQSKQQLLRPLKKQRLMTVLDTETTGLIENVTVKDDKLPEVIDFYGCVLDVDSGKLLEELDVLIKPTIAKKLPQETIDITHITDAMLKDCAIFADHSDDIFALIERKAPVVAAHNAAYDKEVLDIEAHRVEYGITWPNIMCTVEQTLHLKGYRLSLSALHELLFGETFLDAHRAKADVQALCRCIVELIKREEIIYHG